MLGLGIFVLLVWAILSFLGAAIELLKDIAIVLIVVGIVVDLYFALTGRASVYSRFRR